MNRREVVTQDQSNRVMAVHEHMTTASTSWPREAWGSEDNYAFFLERLLARAVGGRGIVLASAKVVWDESKNVCRFEASVFTDQLIFAGSIDVAPAPEGTAARRPYPRVGNVAVVPRCDVKAVTLHEVDNFGEHGDENPDVIGFTVEVDGLTPIEIPMPRYDHARSGDHSRLFDSLLEDLARKGETAIVR